MARALSTPGQQNTALVTRRRLLFGVCALSVLSILSLTTRSSSRARQRKDEQHTNSNPSSEWHDHDTISRLTRRAYHTVVPKLVTHLDALTVAEPFRTVYIVSGWVDTRPLITGSSPEIVLLSTANSSKEFFQREFNQFESNPLHCFVSVRLFSTGETVHFNRPSILQPQDAPDGHPGQAAWIYAQHICPLELEDGKPIAGWEDSEIFATLSLPTLDPFHDSFVRVEQIPKLDVASHKAGEGASAMCLPPLIGDMYAPFLADYFAHYRALGFTKFYPYLLDPGPETLKVLRELMFEYDGMIEAVRWSIPKRWTKPTGPTSHPIGRFLVHPADWHIDAIDVQPVEIESQLIAPAGSSFGIKLWYYGQGPATQDCAYRAMQAGSRWMIAPDYDEWLLLRPAGQQQSWPPEGTTASDSIPAPPLQNNLITTFAQSVVPNLTTEWLHFYPPEGIEYVHQRLLKKGALASAYQFRSAFFCMTCRPEHAPTEDNAGAQAVQKVLGNEFSWTRPGLSVPFAFSSPVRHMDWFPEGRRTKTLVDPWAWRHIGIHVTTLSYFEWSIVAGACSWAKFNSAPPRKDRESYDYGAECAMKYLEAFGPATYLVDPGNQASNSTSRVEPSLHSRGGIAHVRVAPQLQEALVEHSRAFGMDEIYELPAALEAERGDAAHENVMYGLDRQEHARKDGRRLVEQARVGPGVEEWKSQHEESDFRPDNGPKPAWPKPRMELVEDWSFAEVMGASLAARLAQAVLEGKGVKQSATSVEESARWLSWWALPWLAVGAVLFAGWNKQRKEKVL